MKLNNECVRYLLLYIEENAKFNGDPIAIDQIPLQDFTIEELAYTASKLSEAGYIDAELSYSDDFYEDGLIKCLTWDGHAFLDSIRDNYVWKTTKSIVSKFSSVSLSIIETVASQVILKIIEKQLGQ